MTVDQLYEKDFLEWATRNVQLLRAGRLQEADIEHIAEEIEAMAATQRRELRNRLRVLLLHLLKWRYQPARRGASWEKTIDTQRTAIKDLLLDMPSLRNSIPEVLLQVYPDALRRAAKETGLSPATFPKACPFPLHRLLRQDYFPS